MGRFQLVKRLLLAIILWPTRLTSCEGISSRTEGDWNGFHIADRVPPRSPFNQSDLVRSATWSGSLKNVTAHKMEKAIVIFPNPLHVYSDHAELGTLPNLTAIVDKIQQIIGNQDENGCQAYTFLSEFRRITQKLFARMLPTVSYEPSWAGVTGSNLWGNKAAVFHPYGKLSGRTSVEVQTGRDGKWTDAFQRNITGKDARYRLNLTAGDVPNVAFALVILVDHFIIVDDLPAKAPITTEVAGAHQIRTGKLFLRYYIPIQNGAYSKTSDLTMTRLNVTLTLNFTKCDDDFVVEKFLQEVVENGWGNPWDHHSVEHGWATSQGMMFLYVLLILMVPSVVGIYLVRWVYKKAGNPGETLALGSHQ